MSLVKGAAEVGAISLISLGGAGEIVKAIVATGASILCHVVPCKVRSLLFLASVYNDIIVELPRLFGRELISRLLAGLFRQKKYRLIFWPVNMGSSVNSSKFPNRVSKLL